MTESKEEAHGLGCACETCKPTPPSLSQEGKLVFRSFAALPEAERERIMAEFCECGSADLSCQCWNDE